MLNNFLISIYLMLALFGNLIHCEEKIEISDDNDYNRMTMANKYADYSFLNKREYEISKNKEKGKIKKPTKNTKQKQVFSKANVNENRYRYKFNSWG